MTIKLKLAAWPNKSRYLRRSAFLSLSSLDGLQYCIDWSYKMVL